MGQRRSGYRGWWGGVLMCLGAIGLVGCGDEAEAPMSWTPVVEVAQPVVKDVTAYHYYTGRLAAINEVKVRARVEGFVQAQHFEAGSKVSVGDPLFTIEREPYEIAVAMAEAQLEEARAAEELAKVELDKIEQAYANQAAIERERLEYVAKHKKAVAQRMAAEASLDDAKLNLSYTQVTALLAGKAGREQVDVGNLVGPGDLLTTIVQMDPIYIVIDVSDRIVQDILNEMDGTPRSMDKAPSIQIRRSSDPPGEYPFEGPITYGDNTMDAGTATLLVRGEIPNDKRLLYPGMPGIQARVPYAVLSDAVLAREDALGTDLTGKFLWVIDEKDVAQKRPVEVGQDAGDGYRVITKGLAADERYVVRGIQMVRAGAPVTVTESAKPSPPAPPEEAEASDTTQTPEAGE